METQPAGSSDSSRVDAVESVSLGPSDRIFSLFSQVIAACLVLLLGIDVYFTSAAYAVSDTRNHWTLGICLLALVMGHLVAIGIERLRTRKQASRLGLPRHGVALLLAILAAMAMTHVRSQDTISAMREAISPAVGFIYPVIAFLSPLLLRLSMRRVDAADHVLLFVLAILTMGGAAFFVEGPLALGLSLFALTSQLGAGGRWPPLNGLSISAGALVLILFFATLTGDNPLVSFPAMTWIATFAFIGLAIASRTRDADSWSRIIAASVAAATLLAFCDAMLTGHIARMFTLQSGLDTRLYLFQKHPNFLASLYSFNALLALGLILGRTRQWIPAIPSFLLLLFATWHTGSNGGKAALIIGVLSCIALFVLIISLHKLRRLTVVLGLATVMALAGGAAYWVLGQGGIGIEAAEEKVERFGKSYEYRMAAWDNSLHVALSNPWLGVGPATLVAGKPYPVGTRFAKETTAPHPHNVPLYVAQSAGFVGLVAFLAWVLFLVLGLLRVAGPGEGHPHRGLLIGTLGACLALFFANMIDLGLSLNTVMPAPIYIITGLLLARQTSRLRIQAPGLAVAICFAVFGLLYEFSFKPLYSRILVHQAWMISVDSVRNWRLPQVNERKLDFYQRAVDLDPTYRAARHQLHLQLGLDEEAKEALLKEGFALAPDSGMAHSALGRHYYRNEQFDQAAKMLAYAVERIYWSRNIQSDRALLIQALAHLGDAEEAEQSLMEAAFRGHQVILELPWVEDDSGEKYLPIEGLDGAEPEKLVLLECLKKMEDRLWSDNSGGSLAARKTWLEVFFGLVASGNDVLAEEYLDRLSGNVKNVEVWTILREKAQLALDRGDFRKAAIHYREAYDASGIPSFLDFERNARAMGDRRQVGTQESRLDEIGDVMAFASWYEIALNIQINTGTRAGDLVKAASAMRSRLFLEDDPIERAELLVELSRLLIKIRADSDEIEEVLRDAAIDLQSKLFPRAELKVVHDESLPGRVAGTLVQFWKSLGRETAEIERDAISLTGAVSGTRVAVLFRIGLYRATGNSKALLREVDLFLLDDPNDELGLWSRYAALEAVTPPAERRFFMRDIILRLNSGRRERPTGDFQVGVERIIGGDFPAALRSFQKAYEAAPQGPGALRALDWLARVQSLSGSHAQAQRTLEQLLRIDPKNQMVRSRLELLK